jgi:Dyp-type peroxidase family
VTETSARLTDETLADIQGFLTSGYGHLPLATYLFLQIHEPRRARRWLETVTRTITSSAPWPLAPDGRKIKPLSAANVALTAAGLAALGLPERTVCTFPIEFQEGIDHPHRSIILGDTDESGPVHWEVGGAANAPIHAVLMVHGVSDQEMDRVCQTQRGFIDNAGGALTEIAVQTGYRPETNREPFGFHDGMGQPSIRGITGAGVPTGEFILGYPNHYGMIPPTPVVGADVDAANVLPPLANPYHATENWRDLGRNGSFVVYRKLHQDVAGFWQFMKREAARATGDEDPARMVWLASRLVGRWPGGAPLVLAPDSDNPRLGERDDFLYRDDPDGFACPLGAHVRRVNPRDVIKPYPHEQSLSMSEAHRLLRRGRVFGRPLFDLRALDHPATPEAARVLSELGDDGEARGLHFFCVNGSIKSQFEFVQQTWCNNPRFGGLHDNRDPVAGNSGCPGDPPSHMTIPARPVAVRTAALPRFVTVKGGAYLFMPSLTALRFLASFKEESSPVLVGGS